MTIPPEALLTRSLRECPGGQKTARILAAALQGVDPGALIKGKMGREGRILHLQDQSLDLDRYQRIILLGIGKAALRLSAAAADILADRLTMGITLTKPGSPPLPDSLQSAFRCYEGAHPIPDRKSLAAAQEIVSQVSNLGENDLVITLISGGGSALFTLPAAGLDLEDLIQTNQLLLGCGADIQEINTIRKHLSAVKGGRLAQAIHPAACVTLLLSDVPGDRLEDIGSGPTVPDPSTYADAIQVVAKYRLTDVLPAPVLRHLQQGAQEQLPETPKPGDTIFDGQITILLGSNRDACQAAARQARAEGFQTAVQANPLDGEARLAGAAQAKILRGLAFAGDPLPRPACLIAGGETTVTLTDSPSVGRGGRNLELALSAAANLAGLEDCALISLATDGEDGNSGAAGAVVTGTSLVRAAQLGLDPELHMKAHNAYPFFADLGDLLLPGPTGTNVNDLCFLFTYKRETDD